jgi:hypothetical protein
MGVICGGRRVHPDYHQWHRDGTYGTFRAHVVVAGERIAAFVLAGADEVIDAVSVNESRP